MSNSITIFIAGIAGVFLGMGLLWLFIKITSIIVDRIDRDKVADQPEQGKAGNPTEEKKEEKK